MFTNEIPSVIGDELIKKLNLKWLDPKIKLGYSKPTYLV
jgi:hypothetical protein